MKTRDYKQFAPDTYYHIYNRGNGKQDIFLDAEDFSFFIFRLRENLDPDFAISRAPARQLKSGVILPRRELLPAKSFDLVAYCLMPNHYHILIRQNKDVSVGKMISKVCTGYSRYFNKKYNRVGTLFQDVFRAVKVESNDYLLWLSAYIHQNPKTAKLVKKISDYPWSSFSEYSNHAHDNFCQKDIILDQFKNGLKEYDNFVQTAGEVIEENKKEIKEMLIDY